MKIREILEGTYAWQTGEHIDYDIDDIADNEIEDRALAGENRELDPYFVNSQATASGWKRVGKGETASVWKHKNQPGKVVKLLGGGYSPGNHYERDIAFKFVKFLVRNGWKSKHFPIIHDINTDDPLVTQIRLEELKPLPNDVADALEEFSAPWDTFNLDKMLKRYKLASKNNVSEIKAAIIMLGKAARKNGADLDLHAGNWLMRRDRTIVAVDPWY